MNPDTNELIGNIGKGEMLKELGNGFEPLPQHLEHAAKRKLAGKTRVTVSKHSGGKLSKYCAKRRKEKRNIAKKSRRANR